MELKWTSKALSGLTRLYEFLAPVNRGAAARTVQSLTAAPTGRHFTAEDTREDYSEPRYITLGTLDGRMVVMVWTPRGEARRIISTRLAQCERTSFLKMEKRSGSAWERVHFELSPV